jgi:hypothetical protein
VTDEKPKQIAPAIVLNYFRDGKFQGEPQDQEVWMKAGQMPGLRMNK